MMKGLILATLLMAPFAVQAQTFEIGPGQGCVSIRTAVGIVGNCAPRACIRKKWAKPAWATAVVTENFARAAARAATIIIAGMGMKRNARSQWALNDTPMLAYCLSKTT